MYHLIEVRDERDMDSPEPWSHYGAYWNIKSLAEGLKELSEELKSTKTILEVRVIGKG